MKKKVVAPRKVGNPVFNYTSVCCEEPAKKPPVMRSPEDVRENKFSQCTLGHWTCMKCGKSCKVTRSRVRESNGRT